MSESKTKVTSFSCVQSRPGSSQPEALPERRARQRHGHVEGDLVQRQVERQREGPLDVDDRLPGVPDDEEGRDLDARVAIHGRRAHALLHSHLFPHEVQRA